MTYKMYISVNEVNHSNTYNFYLKTFFCVYGETRHGRRFFVLRRIKESTFEVKVERSLNRQEFSNDET